MQVQVAPTHRAPAAWLPLLLVAIVLMVASFAGGVAYDEGPDRAPAITTVERDAPEVTQMTAVRHPSEREVVALKS
jgi:hypothetical protein